MFRTTAEEFCEAPALQDEIFGPACLVVEAGSSSEVLQAIGVLEGQLTGTVIADPADYAEAVEIVLLLLRRVGRVIWNGMPTGVAVSPAMHHGGPYPASTAPFTTSVGPRAIDRFVRPVCLQDVPIELLAYLRK